MKWKTYLPFEHLRAKSWTIPAHRRRYNILHLDPCGVCITNELKIISSLFRLNLVTMNINYDEMMAMTMPVEKVAAQWFLPKINLFQLIAFGEMSKNSAVRSQSTTMAWQRGNVRERPFRRIARLWSGDCMFGGKLKSGWVRTRQHSSDANKIRSHSPFAVRCSHYINNGSPLLLSFHIPFA